MDNSFACGASTCQSGTDLGGCNPFRFVLTAPANKPYGSWKHWNGTAYVPIGETGKKVLTVNLNVTNGSTLLDIYRYDEETPPNLEATLCIRKTGTTGDGICDGRDLAVKPGDQVEFWQKVKNTGSPTDAFIHNNLSLNGNDNDTGNSHNGTRDNAYDIVEAVDAYNTQIADTETRHVVANSADLPAARASHNGIYVKNQDSAEYLPNAYSWAYHTISGNTQLGTNETYWIHFDIRIKNDTSLVGKYIANEFGAGLDASMTGKKTSTQAHIKIVSDTACSCSAVPQKGNTPLAVKVIVTGGSGTYTYNMGEGTPLTDRGSEIYYTYKTPGPKNITVNDSSACSCNTTVNVTNPSGGSGGEVAP